MAGEADNVTGNDTAALTSEDVDPALRVTSYSLLDLELEEDEEDEDEEEEEDEEDLDSDFCFGAGFFVREVDECFLSDREVERVGLGFRCFFPLPCGLSEGAGVLVAGSTGSLDASWEEREDPLFWTSIGVAEGSLFSPS